MADTEIIVINARDVIATLNRNYERERHEWECKCAGVRASFKKKKSRKEKNGTVYEYTNWYRETSGGGLESVGKQEPDYAKYYPPEPRPAISFKCKEYEGHVLLDEKDVMENQELFKKYLAFRLDDCRNLAHPLYMDPKNKVHGRCDAECDSCKDKYPSVEEYLGGPVKGRKRKKIKQSDGWDFNNSKETLGCAACINIVSPGQNMTGWVQIDGDWYCPLHVNSVQTRGVSSARSRGMAGQKKMILADDEKPEDEDETIPAAHRVCKVCGCTNSTPCHGGCAWVKPDLCSSCASDEEIDAAIPERPDDCDGCDMEDEYPECDEGCPQCPGYEDQGDEP